MTLPSKNPEGQGNRANWTFLNQYMIVGKGAPEGEIRARIGAIYTRVDGSEGATFYVKESGDGTDTGWKVK